MSPLVADGAMLAAPPPLEQPEGLSQSYVDLDLEPLPPPTKPQLLGRPEPVSPPPGSPQPLPKVRQPEEAALESERQVGKARRVSIASLVASLVACLLGFSIGYAEEVLSLIGFGMESLLDGISSGLVLWRFKRGKKREHADAEAAAEHKVRRDARRERNSSIGIGATFVFSAFLLLLVAVIKVKRFDPTAQEHIEEEKAGAFYGTLLSWPAAFVFGGLALAKFALARELESQVLEKDALCSVLGAILALICGTASLIELASTGNPHGMEMVDVAASAVIALLLGGEGVRTLCHNLVVDESRHQPMA